MRYILFASGVDSFKDTNINIQSDDYLIAVDGGIKCMQKNNLNPKIFFGDNDSFADDLENIKATKYIYKKEKDYSDLELALMYLEKQKIKEEIIILNATGGRLDHFFGAISLLLLYQDLNIKIIDGQNKIYLIKNSTEVTKSTYHYFSLFNPYKDTIISLTGFKYEINDYQMAEFCNLCLSNEIIDRGYIKTNKPLIIIESSDIKK